MIDAQAVSKGSVDDSSSVDANSSKNAAATAQKNSHPLLRDIEEMMYGYGDAWPSDPESVKLMESLVTDYIQSLCTNALKVSELAGKIDKESFLFLVRKDKQKYERVVKLLRVNEDMKNMQKIEFNEDLEI